MSNEPAALPMEDVIGPGWAAEPASGGAGHQRRQPVARRPEAAAPASGSAATAAAGGAAKFKLGDQVLCSGRDKGIVEDVSCTQGHWVYTVKGARQDQADKKKKKQCGAAWNPTWNWLRGSELHPGSLGNAT